MRLRKTIRMIGLCALFWMGTVAPVQSVQKHDAEYYQGGGFYALYAENRREQIPNLITEDFLLQAYSMQRAKSLKAMEKRRLLPALDQLLRALAARVTDGSSIYSAQNKAYIEVLQALLSADDLPSATEKVQSELALVRAAAATELSPLWGYSIDYSQFKAHGQYSGDPDLHRYYVASRYANSILFPVVPSAATGISAERAEQFARLALEFSLLLTDPSVAPAYEQLSGMLDWQFGKADDLSPADVLNAQTRPGQHLSDSLRNYAQAHDKVPSILSLPVQVDKLEAGLSAHQALIGWRLLPARRSNDAQAMQRLVFDHSDGLRWPCSRCAKPALASAYAGAWYKAYPSYLELMAANGSASAAKALAPLQLSDYNDYSARFASLDELYQRSTGLASLQLKVLQAALARDSSTQALHAGAGFWLWQRYSAQLYQKQSSTPYSKAVALDFGKRVGALLEPNAQLYSALMNLSNIHAEAEGDARWVELSKIFERCVSISIGWHESTLLSQEDQDFLNGLDSQLQVLTGRDDAPIVMDIHRNYQDQKVLQMALGKPRLAFEKNARGARFSVHEFLKPMAQTLDNRTWRQNLLGAR